MRRRTIAAALTLAAAAMAAPARAQDQDLSALLPKPTPEHAMLKNDVGTWDAKIKAYMGGPDAPPEVSDGVETNRMLGEFWVLSDFEGSFGGMPFSGHGQIGFDTRADHFVMTWVDSMSTAPMSLTGTYDPSSKTLTMIGKTYDPMLEKEVEHKSVSKAIDEDHRVFTMYMKAPEYGDDWVKGMEIEYTRRPGEPQAPGQ